MSEVQLSNEAADAFASNPGAADDSDLLIYKDAAGASNDSAIREKIQQALNSAASAKLTNAVTQDADGNPVKSIGNKDPATPQPRFQMKSLYFGSSIQFKDLWLFPMSKQVSEGKNECIEAVEFTHCRPKVALHKEKYRFFCESSI